ncbi:MAG: LysR family transcriptional regulator [Rhodobacter sp.]|nr:LysR family transcriptional regulator [Paracoccaceae bacterium]MCB1410499.1 LysR family transcriptional regulator [Paracoccaceae bacterium]MCC0079088.1 LysR family transcriptional regulator [Rhodobacter sp.]
MRRNLDLAALRALAAIADFGGVTRAAHVLNLTQSAVSMQIKRLEDALDLTLLDRSGRGVSLTGEGEQLLAYARRILALNDEAVERLTDSDFEGEIVIIVPHDIVYPHIPQVLRHFQTMFPRMQVQLQARNTRKAKEAYLNGDCDLILTTEQHCGPGGETLTRLPLIWIGAPGGQAWRQRPLRLALGRYCAFRPGIVAALDRAGISWEAAVESDSDRTLEAAVSCDMAIHALLAGTEPPHAERIAHGGALPDLGSHLVNLYIRPGSASPGVLALADLLRKAWDGEGVAIAAAE